MTLAPTGAGVEIVELLAEDEARELTEVIRRNIDDLRRTDEQVWRLLMVAYEREAWRALGYGSWREYATREYGLSQTNAYRLLDKARVVAALEEATGSFSHAWEISAREVEVLKPHLPAITRALRSRVNPNMTDEAIAAVVAELVSEVRALVASDIRAGDQVADDSDEVRTVAGVEQAGQEVIIYDETGDALVVNSNKELPVRRPPIVKPDLGDGVSHPARYSDELFDHFRELLAGHTRVLDPFAGTGRIHELRPEWKTFGIEIEPEWAKLSRHTRVGNALRLPYDDEDFDAVCTSPTYGNRLSDHYEASDAHLRRSYMHDLGRPLADANSGRLQWGDKYRTFHAVAWREAVRVLRTGGVFILNIKDHIRDGHWQDVAGWHHKVLTVDQGLEPIAVRPVATRSLRQGTNGDVRVDAELILAFRKVAL